MFHELMVAMGDSLSNIASSEDWEVGEHDDDDETEQVELTEDDEAGWVTGTINKTVQ
jgi:hypothetical protein